MCDRWLGPGVKSIALSCILASLTPVRSVHGLFLGGARGVICALFILGLYARTSHGPFFFFLGGGGRGGVIFNF